MTVAVVIPYRAGDPDRDRAFDWVLNHYRTEHPWPVFHADCKGRWSKGAAVAEAIAQTDADVLVVADADSFTDPDTITRAVQIVSEGYAPWVVPHAKVYRQTSQMTDKVLSGAEPSKRYLARRRYEAVWGGGITIIRHNTYNEVPIDPRFYDWGGEDFCWAWALQTIVGEPMQLDGDLFHLWHPHPSPNYDKPQESVALKAKYLAARRHPGQMRAVLAGRDYQPPPLAAEPRRFRSATPTRTLRCGSTVVRFRNHHLETNDPDLAEAIARFANVQEV